MQGGAGYKLLHFYTALVGIALMSTAILALLSCTPFVAWRQIEGVGTLQSIVSNITEMRMVVTILNLRWPSSSLSLHLWPGGTITSGMLPRGCALGIIMFIRAFSTICLFI
jgi:hypothetical protein